MYSNFKKDKKSRKEIKRINIANWIEYNRLLKNKWKFKDSKILFKITRVKWSFKSCIESYRKFKLKYYRYTVWLI